MWSVRRAGGCPERDSRYRSLATQISHGQIFSPFGGRMKDRIEFKAVSLTPRDNGAGTVSDFSPTK